MFPRGNISVRNNFSILTHSGAVLDSFAGLESRVSSHDGCKARREGSREALRGPAGPCAIGAGLAVVTPGLPGTNRVPSVSKFTEQTFSIRSLTKFFPSSAESQSGSLGAAGPCRTRSRRSRAPCPSPAPASLLRRNAQRLISPGENGNFLCISDTSCQLL